MDQSGINRGSIGDRSGIDPGAPPAPGPPVAAPIPPRGPASPNPSVPLPGDRMTALPDPIAPVLAWGHCALIPGLGPCRQVLTARGPGETVTCVT